MKKLLAAALAAATAELIKFNGYKTDQGLQNIVNLAWDMNKEGKSRKISHSEYLAKFISPE